MSNRKKKHKNTYNKKNNKAKVNLIKNPSEEVKTEEPKLEEAKLEKTEQKETKLEAPKIEEHKEEPDAQKVKANDEKTCDFDRISKLLSLGICAFVLVAGMIVGFMISLRPAMSEIEQRNLATFPKASFENVMSGDFFSDLALWYADSYPYREDMIAAHMAIKNNYGITTETKMVGSDIAADEIPDFDMSASANIGNANKKPMVSNSSNAAGSLSSDNAISDNSVSDNSASSNMVSKSISENFVYTPDESVPLPSSTNMEAEIKKNIQQNLYVKDGAAYSKYYFSKGSASIYIGALEKAAARLSGKCNVINILVPNQSGAMLPYDEMIALGGSNQIEAIHYYYSQYQNVYTVDTIDTLREHQDEYLYFKTDHHWTATGAYYVYRNYCELKGWKPHELSYFKEMTFDPFLGSFYSQLQDPYMREHPDYVKAYVPRGTNTLVYWDTAGTRHDWQVITDVSNWNAYSGYCCFVGGDKPLAIIENPEIKDGSACLVIKESYGNCFIPFLVDHYQTVYIMDCRYMTNNIINFVEENNIQDLIFINNITIIGSSGLCNRIATLLE